MENNYTRYYGILREAPYSPVKVVGAIGSMLILDILLAGITILIGGNHLEGALYYIVLAIYAFLTWLIIYEIWYSDKQNFRALFKIETPYAKNLKIKADVISLGYKIELMEEHIQLQTKLSNLGTKE